MKVLMWHVHGSWSTAFVAGAHEVLVPVNPERDTDGLGLPTTYTWPDTVREVRPEEIRTEDVDLIVLQRVHELSLLEQWSGIRAGVDVPAVYVEHNAPTQSASNSRHPMAEQSEIPIVHVSYFNALMWDNGRAPVHVIEHGIPDPGHQYTGALPRLGVVVNEPLRRKRITGTDLLPAIGAVAGVDVFGMGTEQLSMENVVGHGDVPHDEMHEALAARRVYVHTSRWTSLGLSLLEAMYLGMPVVALSTTEAPEALARSAAIITNNPEVMQNAIRDYLFDPGLALESGRLNRSVVAARHNLERFFADWDGVFKEVLS